MARTPDPRRPAELLDAIVGYLAVHSLSELSLRPLAKAVGSSPRALLYHFGSKENLLVQAFAHLRDRQRSVFEQLEAAHFDSSSSACSAIWLHMRAPESEATFRLFFEAYGLALRYPRRYQTFLHSAIDDWLDYLMPPLRRQGHSPAQARAIATVLLAGFRGFMLDYCASRDRNRLDRAVRLWAQALDSIPVAKRDRS